MSEPSFLVYTARQITAFATDGGHVIMQLDCKDLGLMPNVRLCFSLKPEEARAVAASLIRKADEAQG